MCLVLNYDVYMHRGSFINELTLHIVSKKKEIYYSIKIRASKLKDIFKNLFLIFIFVYEIFYYSILSDHMLS